MDNNSKWKSYFNSLHAVSIIVVLFLLQLHIELGIICKLSVPCTQIVQEVPQQSFVIKQNL